MNFSGHDEPADNGEPANDEPANRRIPDWKIKKHAERIAQWEGVDDWDQFVEQAKDEITWENFQKWQEAKGWKKTNTYDYESLGGYILYQSVRFEYQLLPSEKKFLLRHCVGHKWTNSAGPVRVPYNLPELIKRADEPITFVEGEKAVESLKQQGLLATCVQGQHWTAGLVKFFTRRTINLVLDYDDAGRRHTRTAVEWLNKVEATIRVIHLPGLVPTQGLDDWLATQSLDDYQAIVAETRPELSSGRIEATSYRLPREQDIERYNWLLGRHLLCGEVSCTAAAGGTGKSSLSLAEALAMASGTRTMLHDNVLDRPLRVVLINLEDSRNTIDKRLAALMRHYGITQDDIADRLIILAKGEVSINIATELKSGEIVPNDMDIERLVQLMKSHNADVLSVDSFIRSHSVNENSNNNIQKVVGCYERVAAKARCAIHLWHHTRKNGGDKASVESVRGAGSFVDSCRSVRVLETMTNKERDEIIQIKPDLKPAGFYFKMFAAKRNFAPPADQADWYVHESVKLRNARSEFENDGDDVGVVAMWRYPKIDLPKMDENNVERVLAAIKQDGPWRADRRAKERWVGVPVARALVLDLLDKRAAKAVAKTVAETPRGREAPAVPDARRAPQDAGIYRGRDTRSNWRGKNAGG
jgi:RecA-family ATPase